MISNTEGALLLEQNPPAGLWGGLWVFPQCESEEQLEETYLKLGVQPDSEQVHEVKRHTFSHFHLDYKPVQITLGSATANASMWRISKIKSGITHKIHYHWECLLQSKHCYSITLKSQAKQTLHRG